MGIQHQVAKFTLIYSNIHVKKKKLTFNRFGIELSTLTEDLKQGIHYTHLVREMSVFTIKPKAANQKI